MGSIDILINNAGGNQIGAIDEIRDEDWDRVMELNLPSSWPGAMGDRTAG